MLQLEKTVSRLTVDMEEAIRNGDMPEACASSGKGDGEKRNWGTKRFQKKQEQRGLSVQEEDIAGVVSQWTKIPVQRLAESESARLGKLEQTLHKRVVGQDEAVAAVAKAVKREESD